MRGRFGVVVVMKRLKRGKRACGMGGRRGCGGGEVT